MHPVGRPLPAEELHGEVEDHVDEEVGQDEDEDVGGGIGKHNVAVWLCTDITDDIVCSS